MLGCALVAPSPLGSPDPRLSPLGTPWLDTSWGASRRLVAHRGWAARFPENTLLALEEAVSAGARYVEIDIQLSSDGRPVLFHDRTLDRMCGVSGPVHARTLADLRALSCAERPRFGERFASVRIAELPGLVDLLRSHREVFAFVEIKRASIEQFGAEAVLEAVAPLLEPVREQVALISFSLPFLALARARSALSSGLSSGLPLGAVFDKFKEREQPDARAIAAEYTFCDVEGLPAEGVLDAKPSKLAVYEVADPALAIDLVRRGVDLVETFAIGDMIPAVRDLEARSR
jgi:glycerophosphoryl diester phosphodiesterase